jgi:hypothetical protein
MSTNNWEFERSVIAAVLKDNRWLKYFRGEILFNDAGHQQIWLAIIKLIDNRQYADVISIVNWLRSEQRLEAAGGIQNIIDIATLSQPWSPPTNEDWYNFYLKSDAWKLKRRKVRDRCGGVCEGCRDHPVTQVHHLTYEHVGNELLYELVGLCDACHERAHER